MSRRTLLAGAASLGALGAASGGGSVLLLSDRSVSTGDTLTGTRMDLRISWHEYDASASVVERHGECGGGFDGYARDDQPAVDLDAAEPGDRGALVVWARCRPPASDVWARVKLWSAAERGRTTAERAAGDDRDEGELQYHLQTTLRSPEGCDYDFYDGDLRRGGRLADVDGHRLRLDGTAAGDDASPACLALEWRLPESAPPTVLSDSVSFGVEFAVVQSRGDGPVDPWSQHP